MPKRRRPEGEEPRAGIIPPVRGKRDEVDAFETEADIDLEPSAELVPGIGDEVDVDTPVPDIGIEADVNAPLPDARKD